MWIKCLTGTVAALSAASAAHADSQSSNTSSNSSSNNGVVRERVVDTYCENGYCQRYVVRRVYRDGRKTRSNRSYYDPRFGYYVPSSGYYDGRRRGDDHDD